MALQEQRLAVSAQRVHTLIPRLHPAMPVALVVGRLQTPLIAPIAQLVLTTVRPDLRA